jgi:hypothetical protein
MARQDAIERPDAGTASQQGLRHVQRSGDVEVASHQHGRARHRATCGRVGLGARFGFSHRQRLPPSLQFGLDGNSVRVP